MNRARYRPAISTGYPRNALLADTTGGAMITTALARLSVVFPRLKVAQLDRGHGVRREVFELEIEEPSRRQRLRSILPLQLQRRE